MASYSVSFKKSVAKDLRNLPNKEIERILERVNSLAENPRAEGCTKLSGKERYRVRQGVFRIIYEIRDYELVVIVVKVAHRSQMYKRS